MLAGLSPVAEMIWAPLLGSFWASVEIVKKYMGVRERDKAHEFEIRHGAPLHSTQATIEAAGGTVAQVIRPSGARRRRVKSSPVPARLDSRLSGVLRRAFLCLVDLQKGGCLPTL
jgi:hypothetical protein